MAAGAAINLVSRIAFDKPGVSGQEGIDRRRITLGDIPEYRIGAGPNNRFQVRSQSAAALMLLQIPDFLFRKGETLGDEIMFAGLAVIREQRKFMQ